MVQRSFDVDINDNVDLDVDVDVLVDISRLPEPFFFCRPLREADPWRSKTPKGEARPVNEKQDPARSRPLVKQTPHEERPLISTGIDPKPSFFFSEIMIGVIKNVHAS